MAGSLMGKQVPVSLATVVVVFVVVADAIVGQQTIVEGNFVDDLVVGHAKILQ